MIFRTPISFEQAAQSHAVRSLLGTELNSAEMSAVLRTLPVAFRNRAFFSAGVSKFNILERLSNSVQNIINREAGSASDRNTIREFLTAIGYDAGDAAGTIHDLSSFARLDVMLNTNLDIAQGYGQFIQSQAVAEDWPAWELYRSESRDVPRGDPSYKGDAGIAWRDRFQQAAQAAGDDTALAAFRASNRMVALKSSALWDHLGSDWEDSLGNPFPPFAWGSGMDVEDVIYSEAVALGLLDDGDKAVSRPIPDFNAELKVAISDRHQVLADTLVEALKDTGVELKDGVLKFK